jgi:hypothetical protein
MKKLIIPLIALGFKSAEEISSYDTEHCISPDLLSVAVAKVEALAIEYSINSLELEIFEFAKVDASAIALAEVDAFNISEFQHVPLNKYLFKKHPTNWSLLTAHSFTAHLLNYQLDYVLLSNSWKRRKTTA